MKKTIVILGIATLGLFGASTARAGVSFGIQLGLPVYAAPAPAPYCAPAPYVAAPYCAPSVVVRPPAVYLPPAVVVRPPFVHYGYGHGYYGYGRGYYYHGHHHH